MPEGEAHRLDDDAGELGLGDGGDAADDQALQQGVDGRGHAGPGRFEDGHQGHDEAGDGPHHHQGHHGRGIAGLEKDAPGPGGGDADAEQQQQGLVGGPLDGHGFFGPGDAAQAGEGVVAEGGIGRPHGHNEALPSGIVEMFKGYQECIIIQGGAKEKWGLFGLYASGLSRRCSSAVS